MSKSLVRSKVAITLELKLRPGERSRGKQRALMQRKLRSEAERAFDCHILASRQAVTVKPLYSRHRRDLGKESAMRRCPLYRGLTFFSTGMTIKS